MTGAYIDMCQYWQTSKITKKLLSPLSSPPSICAKNEISSKLMHLPLFVQSYDIKDDSANIGKCQESQTTIFIGEFSTFTLFAMQNFVENG